MATKKTKKQLTSKFAKWGINKIHLIIVALLIGLLGAYLLMSSHAESASCTGGCIGIAAAGQNGYWVVDSIGGVFTSSNATFYGSVPQRAQINDAVGIVATPSRHGYWIYEQNGGVHAFGDAPYKGSMGGQHLNQPIIGMAATPSGGGYWLVGRDGGIFSFGDAGYFNSLPGRGDITDKVVGLAARPQGDGYWTVESNGWIVNFGNAPDLGSLGRTAPVAHPVTGMAVTPSGNGYWEIGNDGGVFAFGDAVVPSPNGLPAMGIHPNSPVVGIAKTPAGDGYWLVGSDGGIFTFGGAVFVGNPATVTTPPTSTTTNSSATPVTNSAPTPTSTSAPRLYFVPSPTTPITAGGSVTLKWNVAGTATSCTAGNDAGDSHWQGAITPLTSGSRTITPPVGTHKYTLECKNAAGSSGIATAGAVVQSAAVTPAATTTNGSGGCVSGGCGTTPTTPMTNISSSTPLPATPTNFMAFDNEDVHLSWAYPAVAVNGYTLWRSDTNHYSLYDFNKVCFVPNSAGGCYIKSGNDTYYPRNRAVVVKLQAYKYNGTDTSRRILSDPAEITVVTDDSGASVAYPPLPPSGTVNVPTLQSGQHFMF